MPLDTALSGPSGIGAPVSRIDGPAKVTGAAVYPSDEAVQNPAYAFLVTSAIARGRILGFNLEEARAVPGVLDILTHETVGSEAKTPPPPGGKGGATTTTLESDRIWHGGQIIAVVVAETFEAAREAAQKVEARVEAEPPAASFGSKGAEELVLASVDKEHHDPRIGDAEAAFAASEVKVEGAYATPAQHHNPLELFTTTCAWRDGRLTIYESSQFVHGLRAAVAGQIGVDPDLVRVVSRFIGGGFGSRGGTTSRTAWIAIAARRLGRPVKLEATRSQGFTIATFRAETRHKVRLAAARDGRLTAVLHEGWEVTSRPSTYSVGGTETTARLYASPNVWTRVNVVQCDRNTPGFMRGPPETPYVFAFESAMDELAEALAMDPVLLRRLNDTQTDPVSGLAYTSRHLNECFEAAAEAFGWRDRPSKPASRREGEWLVGYGCATAVYPANIGVSSTRLVLGPTGAAKVEMGAQDIGTGTYTIIAQVAADRLGLDLKDIEVRIGDTELPAAGLSAGSNHASAVCNVVAKACEEARARIAAAAVRANDSPLSGLAPEELRLRGRRLVAPNGASEALETAAARLGGKIEIYAENVPRGAPADGVSKLYKGQMAMARGSELKDEVRYAFGAQFVEVKIHERTREIRVPRMTGAFAAGAIINPKTTRSQLMGGMIWGMSAALLEATEVDASRARYVNDDLAEYLIPVNADVDQVEVILVPEHDGAINELGMKGVGELGVIGMNAALANAVYNAVGVRVRELPIRVEKLL